jgi:trimethylamine--corrinoid protein Co-methyltransferase
LAISTSQSSYNSPEFIRAYACEVEMAKWLDIPNWGFSGHTDAQVVDAQAGMEADEITKLSMQLGANLNHDVGYMDFGLSGSLAEVVLVAEFIARNRRLLAEIEVSDDTLAVDVLRAVGPGGDFLGQRHTRRHLRSSQWRAQLLNRASHDRWLEGGGLDVTEKARQKARELLATHEVQALPAELIARLDAVVPAG